MPAARGLQRSRGAVQRLAALFALDAFAGSFIVASFLAFWFGRQFSADTELIGLVFFGVGLLQAASSIAAGWLGERIGLLNTMVFTHLPSNVLLHADSARADARRGRRRCSSRARRCRRWTCRRGQGYVAALVDPAERTAAAGYTNAARHIVRPAGPVLASVSMAMAPGVPFLIAGGLKIVYDLAVYFTLPASPPDRRLTHRADRAGGALYRARIGRCLTRLGPTRSA